MKSLPSHVRAYQRTKEFTETTIPAGLTSRHSTKAGVWGRICIVDGSLRYRILEPESEPEEILLTPAKDGVVEPQIAHQVEPIGPVRFYVEFLRPET